MLKKFIREKIIFLIENRTNPLKREIKKLHSLYLEMGRASRKQIMDYAFEFSAKNDLNGSYLEFGCYSGTSFIRAFKAYQKWLSVAENKKWKLRPETMYIFDSFKGLPDLEEQDRLSDYEIFDKGQYTCSEEVFKKNLIEAGVDMEMVKIIPGFYSESLNEKLKSKLNNTKALVVHIDCDLYSSAILALNFITDIVQDGTLILFDDYFCYRGNPEFGVQKAFNEWKKNENISSSSYINYEWAGKAFIIHRPCDYSRQG
ncbi:TylF/MycF/NovP-related O-methyltransferase [Thermodesulfobacteriota bacterium]